MIDLYVSVPGSLSMSSDPLPAFDPLHNRVSFPTHRLSPSSANEVGRVEVLEFHPSHVAIHHLVPAFIL